MTDCLITVILSLLAKNPPEGRFAVEQISHDILYYITKLFIFQLLTPPQFMNFSYILSECESFNRETDSCEIDPLILISALNMIGKRGGNLFND